MDKGSEKRRCWTILALTSLRTHRRRPDERRDSEVNQMTLLIQTTTATTEPATVITLNQGRGHAAPGAAIFEVGI